MDFSFFYKVRPQNLWLLSMVHIYRSMVGVVNIIFTLSMVLLFIRYQAEANGVIGIIIIPAILLFPVFQPLLIFLRSRRIVDKMPRNMVISFNKEGMDITAEERNSHVDFKDLKSVIRISGMLIIYTRAKQGFILNSQILGDKGIKLYDFLSEHVKK